ncbi:MAG TPA: hypothetical protein VIB00_08475, partial [Pyrinomonadaceae bacterium]
GWNLPDRSIEAIDFIRFVAALLIAKNVCAGYNYAYFLSLLIRFPASIKNHLSGSQNINRDGSIMKSSDA